MPFASDNEIIALRVQGQRTESERRMFWTQAGPKLFSIRSEDRFRHAGDNGRSTAIGFLRSLGVNPQQHGRIMTTASSYDMHRNASVEKGGLVTPAQVMEAQLGKPPANPILKSIRHRLCVTQLCEVDVTAGEARKH